jgi:hypothetical protein
VRRIIVEQQEYDLGLRIADLRSDNYLLRAVVLVETLALIVLTSALALSVWKLVK